MNATVKKSSLKATVVLGGAMLLGVLEFVALQRSLLMNRLGRDEHETAQPA